MHESIQDFLVLMQTLYKAMIYIKPKPVTHITALMHTHTHTHTCYSFTSVGSRTSGSPICDGCWICCCFLLNFTFWRETVNWVSSWVSVADNSHMQFGIATVCLVTKNCFTEREMWQGECIWSVIRMLHYISGFIGWMAFLQTFRNTK